MKNNTLLKKIGKIALCVVLFIVLLVSGYATYFVTSFTRIGDHVVLTPTLATSEEKVITSKQYNLLSWNVGFGAYSDDYSFFMDGGKYSRAFSEQAVNDNIKGIASAVEEAARKHTANGFDFICYQEIDYDSTRSYFVDQREFFKGQHPGYASVFAQNYNSPYILYPFNSPHGANKSGLMTFSKYKISTAMRRELQMEAGFMKYFDLDRCYSKSKIPVSNGKYLVLINLHLSAYTSDGTISTEQLKRLLADCKQEYDAGNYVVCAGDFNKDFIDEAEGGSSKLFDQPVSNNVWVKSMDPAIFEGTNMIKVAPLDRDQTIAPIPTCRNANLPYTEDIDVYIVDGFLVSENVHVYNAFALDEQFKHSDHNPVVLSFRLI